MSQDQEIDAFLERSSASMDINALGPNWEEKFVRSVQKLKNPERQAQFQRGFAKAVLGGLTAKMYEAATGWSFDSEEEFRAHLKHYWDVFYPDAKPEDFASPTASINSMDGYRGWKNQEGDTVYYTVERVDGTVVIRVTVMELVDRTLHICYELASPSMYDGFARQLIRRKILIEVCLGSYDRLADTVAYTSTTTMNVHRTLRAERLKLLSRRPAITFICPARTPLDGHDSF